MITEYELYSDERREHGVGANYLTLGGVICTEKGRQRLLSNFQEVRNSHGLTGEVGWKKISMFYLSGYKAWLDVFFDDPYVRYSLLSIDRSSQDWQTFRARRGHLSKNDQPLASTYYQFLLIAFRRLHDTQRWRVYPDAGYFSRNNVLNQVEFLFNRTYKKAFGTKSTRIIRLARALDSKRNDLIQLADLLLGCAACSLYSHAPESVARQALLTHYQARCNLTPTTRTGLPKLYSCCWVPPDQFFAQREPNADS